MPPAQHLLDHVQSLERVDALERDPAAYAELIAAEVPAAASLSELEARDAMLAAALTQIDAMIARAMRIRLDHALAGDSSIGAPTRTVFATTIIGYVDKLDLLGQRARDVAARGRAPDPDRIAELVLDAARAVLELRAAIRLGVLALVRRLATGAAPEADRQARDRTLGEPARRRWSAVRRDLETIAADPEHMLTGPMTARLAAYPDQLDEGPPEPEVTFADMLELD